MDREPLYQRVEHLIRSRRGFVIAFWSLCFVFVAAPVAWMVVQGLGSGNVRELSFAAFMVLMLGGVAISRAVRLRRVGRAGRTRVAQTVGSRSKWPALDQALDAYALRTGTHRPSVSYMPRATADEETDAELVYAAPPVPGASTRPYRGPLDALPGDEPVIVFSEAMLDEYDAEELLAVIAHLMARGAILREGTNSFGNGAREADSRALLLTHDHASLLRALQSCTKRPYSLHPGVGVVRFSDQDLQTRTALKSDHPDWDSHDRMEELRSHLMAAGLDVPEGGTSWPALPEAKPAPPALQAAFGVVMVALALGWLGALVQAIYDEARFLMMYPDLAPTHIREDIVPWVTLLALVGVFGYPGVRMFVGARRAKRRDADGPSTVE